MIHVDSFTKYFDLSQSNELLIRFFKAQLGSFSRRKLGLVVVRTYLRFSNPVVEGKDSL